MLRIVSTAFVLLIAGIGIAMTPATHAAAAAPAATCTGTTTVRDASGGYLDVPSIGGNTDCLLGVGDVSAAVFDLQSNLNDCYNSGLALDSDFGPATKAALQAAQRDAGITADGVYGPVTRDHLFWQVSGVPACSIIGL